MDYQERLDFAARRADDFDASSEQLADRAAKAKIEEEAEVLRSATWTIGKRYPGGAFKPVFLRLEREAADRLLRQLKEPQEPGQEWELYKWETKQEH